MHKRGLCCSAVSGCRCLAGCLSHSCIVIVVLKGLVAIRVLDRHKKVDVRTSCLQFFGIQQSLLDVLHSLGLQCYAVISVVTAPPPTA